MRPRWILVALATAVVSAIAIALAAYEATDDESIAEAPAPAACEPEARDRNTGDVRIPPKRGDRLIPPQDGAIRVGFNDSSHQEGWVTLAQALRLYNLAGATITRLPLDWGAVETSPGELDFAAYDAIYCEALAAGVQPLWHLTGIPDWAAPLGHCEDPCVRPPQDEHLPQLERFAELAAIRYPRAAAMEAWNEPNLQGFWRSGSPDPAAYLPVLEAIYTGVKNGRPGMPVLGGALSNNPEDAGIGLSLHNYLGGMLAGGAADYMDGFSLHAYPIRPLGDDGDQFLPALEISRDLLQAGAPGTRVWITEVGVPTEASFAPPYPYEQQAEILMDVYAAANDSPDVDAVLFHALMDVPEGHPGAPGFGFYEQPNDEGVVNVKPAVCALRAAVVPDAADGDCPTSLQL